MIMRKQRLNQNNAYRVRLDAIAEILRESNNEPSQGELTQIARLADPVNWIYGPKRQRLTIRQKKATPDQYLAYLDDIVAKANAAYEEEKKKEAA
jgi:hypothetical protein